MNFDREFLAIIADREINQKGFGLVERGCQLGQ